ncbi:hypothetical protein MPC4_80179 [Methylocella tundrae]|uniref:Uncharacterized protein n=1 Tax=Methylocella tundrae TaxID=227605 RepID=A0A8B6MD84_METTU|nr:hypothetical protein [Methylocella tundrae]VTZ26736.1 hypothetical protein MPC1_3750003 [Methylocella tundrae]VTZ52508.1 hypothetical protein MPC4_80179 [Methylocella tundrae]
MSNPDLLELAICEGAAKVLRARAEAAAARAEDRRTMIGLKTGGALVISTAESALEERNARDWRALADEIEAGLGEKKNDSGDL